jgi:integrase/recombinase XerD
MQTSITTWRNWLQLCAAPTTIDAYTYELTRLATHFPDRDLCALTFNDLTAYLAHRREIGAGQSTIYRATNALKSFYKFHCGKRSSAARLPLHKPPLTKQRSLTLDQISALLATCDTSTPIGRRDLALISFAIDTGFRSAELCRIADTAVDVQNRLAYVVIKGGQTGFGTFSEETAAFCATWRADRASVARSGAFFVGFEGHRPGEQLTPEGLRCLMRRLGQRAGLNALSPHDLRRTFATITTLLGAPSRIVQIGGRWSDLRLVERYTQTINPDAIAPYSPIKAAVHQVTR